MEKDVGEFSDMITEIAKIKIGIFKNSSPRSRVPRWNEKIKKFIQNKNKALKNSKLPTLKQTSLT